MCFLNDFSQYFVTPIDGLPYIDTMLLVKVTVRYARLYSRIVGGVKLVQLDVDEMSTWDSSYNTRGNVLQCGSAIINELRYYLLRDRAY
jgi:hypothetical protein